MFNPGDEIELYHLRTGKRYFPYKETEKLIYIGLHPTNDLQLRVKNFTKYSDVWVDVGDYSYYVNASTYGAYGWRVASAYEFPLDEESDKDESLL